MMPSIPSPNVRPPSNEPLQVPAYVRPDAQVVRPVRVDRYDPGPDRRRQRRPMRVFMTLWMIPAIMALPLIVTNTFTPIAVLLVVVAVLAFPCSLLVAFNTLCHVPVPNRPGLMVTGEAIMAACSGDGMREVAVTPPIISLSNQEWHLYEMARNDVGGLWFQPTVREHTYTLYWRDDAYPRLEGTYNMDHVGYRLPSRSVLSFSRGRVGEWLGRGVDLRMRPCVLHVLGGQVWVTFPPDTPLIDAAPQDANIRPGVDGTGV